MSNVAILDKSPDLLFTIWDSTHYTSPESNELVNSIRKLTRNRLQHSNSLTDVETLFQDLVRMLELDCMLLSSLHEISTNRHFEMIVAVGVTFVPFLLADLEQNPNMWRFLALREITKSNPVKPEHRGIVDKMAQDWLEWADSMSWM